MTDSRNHHTDHERFLGERTGSIWNSTERGADAEDQIITHMEHLAASIRPHHRFKSNLKEKLMDTAMTPARSLPIRPVAHATHQPKRTMRRAPQSSAMATFLLVALLIGSAVLYGRPLLNGGGDSPGPAPLGAATSPGTPSHALGTPTDSTCLTSDQGGRMGRQLASIVLPEQAWTKSVSYAGRYVSIAKWTMPLGSVTTEPAAPNDASRSGIGIDVILDGFYSATFDMPVIVATSNPLSPKYEIPAGTPVDLSHGDVVAYPLGAGETISTSGKATPLSFLRTTVSVQPRDSRSSRDSGVKVDDLGSTLLTTHISDIFHSSGGNFEVLLGSADNAPATVPTPLCVDESTVRLMRVTDPDANVASSFSYNLWVSPFRG